MASALMSGTHSHRHPAFVFVAPPIPRRRRCVFSAYHHCPGVAMTPTKTIRRLAEPLLCAAAALLIITGLPDVASATPSGPTHKIGTNAILGQVARPTGSAIQPLHRLTGSVRLTPQRLSAASIATAPAAAAAAAPGV